MTAGCFHCAEPLPPGEAILARVGGEPRAVCCHGCRAVAEFIDGAGFTAFYDHREAPAAADADLKPAEQRFGEFDRPGLRAKYVRREGEADEAILEIGGMYCTACAWLIDRTLERLPAVHGVDVNPATRRAIVRFDGDELPFSRLLGAIARAGFRPVPLGSDAASDENEREYKAALKRLIVAAAAGMQVMMFAIALYAGEHFGIDGAIERFLRVVSLLVTLPIVFYSARPFFRSAWRGLRARAPGMDVPVSLAIAIAFAASVRAVWAGSGAIYFDSVAMFVLFLSGTRFLEMRARHRSDDQALSLARLLPDLCVRVAADGSEEHCEVSRLATGDLVRIRPGDVLPSDGEIVDGCLDVDESVLTGESLPVRRGAGAPAFAGGTNVAGTAVLRITRTGSDTSLAEVGRLLERAKADRPRVAMLADRIAVRFVAGVLVIAAATGAFWLVHAAGRAFEIVLATLVVTCPCALALATPAALAAAATRLSRIGAFLVRSRVLDVVRPGATLVFDKTGTLTRGRPRVAETRLFAAGGERCEAGWLGLAAATEAASEHVLARAFAEHAGPEHDVTAVETVAGAGVEAVVDGRLLRIGRLDWVAALSGEGNAMATDAVGTRVYLGGEQGLLAGFVIADELRPDAPAAIAALAGAGFDIVIASGDNEATVRDIARRLGVPDWHAGLTPAGQVELVRRLQNEGRRVVMIGDGINDAPVLEAADASLAMDAGTALARASADAIVLGRRLMSVHDLAMIAAATRRIVRQNVAWAIGYNLAAVPLAAAGWLSPWMAALGMSASSLVVVSNALRLNRSAGPRRTRSTCGRPAEGQVATP